MLIIPADTAFQTSEPLRQSHWRLEFTSTPVGPSPKDRDMEIRTTPPFVHGSSLLSSMGVNTIVSVPRGQESFSGCFGFHLWTKTDLFDWWMAWRKKVYDEENDQVGLYNEVVGQGVLTFFNPADRPKAKPEAAFRFKLIDVFPSAVTLSELSQDSEGEAVGYTVDLQISAVKKD